MKSDPREQLKVLNLRGRHEEVPGQQRSQAEHEDDEGHAVSAVRKQNGVTHLETAQVDGVMGNSPVSWGAALLLVLHPGASEGDLNREIICRTGIPQGAGNQTSNLLRHSCYSLGRN